MSGAKKGKSASKETAEATLQRVNTALHVLQGAFGRVLGSAVLLGANAVNASSGKLMLELAAAPTDAQVAAALQAAQACVERDVAVHSGELARDEADARHAATLAAPVNGTLLYGARAPPPSFLRVSTVAIADWCLAHAAGPFLASTAAVGPIRLQKTDFAPDRRRFTLFFELDPPSAAPSPAPADAAAADLCAPAPPRRRRYDDALNVQQAALRLLDIALPAVPGDAARDAARRNALAQLEPEVFQFKNAAYTAGFVAATAVKR